MDGALKINDTGANLVCHFLCCEVILKEQPRTNRALEIKSDKKTLSVMYHFNIPFQLATVEYLRVAQDLSCLASSQLA